MTPKMIESVEISHAPKSLLHSVMIVNLEIVSLQIPILIIFENFFAFLANLNNFAIFFSNFENECKRATACQCVASLRPPLPSTYHFFVMSPAHPPLPSTRHFLGVLPMRQGNKKFVCGNAQLILLLPGVPQNPKR